MSAVVKLAALAPLALSLALACDHPVQEPTPDPRSAVDDHVSERSPGDPKPKRCIMQTPEKPSREVTGPVPDPSCPPDDDKPPKLSIGTVRFPEAAGADAGTIEVAVEIADKDKDRMRGLMYRTAMGPDQGMLFVFEEDQVSKFWMKNTCIPLDMLFIAEDGTIVGIEENTPTLSLDTFTANCEGRYVLEVNAGWARKHGIKAGQKAAIVR